MITMLSDSMMTWFTPTMRPGAADGINTFHNSCRRVHPAIWPDSMDSEGTCSSASIVTRTMGGVA